MKDNNTMYAKLEAVDFQSDKSYKLKFKRTTVIFAGVMDGLFEIRSQNRGKKAEARPWTTRKDLPGSIRNHANYPDSGDGITITCIETGEVVFDGNKKD